MDNEHEMEQLKQELEALRRENERLKQELASLKSFRESSFKEKYAVKILDSFPDMLTVFDHEGRGVEVVSSEETNHVACPVPPSRGCP